MNKIVMKRFCAIYSDHSTLPIITILSKRFYQSELGVYGYKAKPKKTFSVENDVIESRNNQSNIYRWVQAYRSHSHRLAKINSVEFRKLEENIPELERSRYGLTSSQEVNLKGILGSDEGFTTIEVLENTLKQIYCKHVSAEFSHIESEYEREWLTEKFENLRNESLSFDCKKDIADILIKSQTWDNFMTVKFPTVKRYGGEGAESMLAFFRKIFLLATEAELEHIILSMPHRGKLNLLTGLLNTKPVKLFRKFKGQPEFPSDVNVMGDIANHFNASEDLDINGKQIHVSMLHNPSHLEAANPVSMGKTRSKQQSARDGAFGDDAGKEFSASVLNIQLHGDAAFAGQGINQESLFMAGTPHFDIGGTIHLIVNNQIGFTTPADRGRRNRYSSDLAKSINAPILHVNGDDSEILTFVTQLAFIYQREFRKDIFIDLNCFRRWGHNELDDPTFTNPALYSIIHTRKSIPDLYVDKLINENVMTQMDVDKTVKEYTTYLNNELIAVDNYIPERSYYMRQWSGFKKASNYITIWDTGLDYSLLGFIGLQSIYYPKNFNIHPHLVKTHVNGRVKKIKEGNIDWATAESFAIGSLMYQGHNVRLSGQDVGRGTFSHRHAMLVDQETNEIFIPLNSLKGGLGGKFEIANSILSEEAVLGFEYGMAIDNPNNLIIWEAQFGDFFNGAQIIFDTFISSGETKWMVSNGLVILLPHGYDGAASEHSSCRMERFLQMTDSKETKPDSDDVNMQVINPTTPAQYYHALRRQIIRDFRKPLIVIAPKILLRLSDAMSTAADFYPGTYFRPVIGDSVVNHSSVKRVILCSGKHYYALKNERRNRNLEDVAIVRMESLCPFPVQELNEELDKYKNAKIFIWSQEEHRNMGAWSFIKPRFENMLGRKIQYSGRYEAGTPAVGVSIWHQKEVEFIVSDPFILN